MAVAAAPVLQGMSRAGLGAHGHRGCEPRAVPAARTGGGTAAPGSAAPRAAAPLQLARGLMRPAGPRDAPGVPRSVPPSRDGSLAAHRAGRGRPCPRAAGDTAVMRMAWLLSPWAVSVPHCCGAVAARAGPAKPFYPCRNKGSFCLLTGAQLSPGGMQQVPAVPSVLPVLLGPQHRAQNTPSAFEVTAPSPKPAGQSLVLPALPRLLPDASRGWHRHRRGTGGLVPPLGAPSQRKGLGTGEISLSRLFFSCKLF